METTLSNAKGRLVIWRAFPKLLPPLYLLWVLGTCCHEHGNGSNSISRCLHPSNLPRWVGAGWDPRDVFGSSCLGQRVGRSFQVGYSKAGGFLVLFSTSWFCCGPEMKRREIESKWSKTDYFSPFQRNEGKKLQPNPNPKPYFKSIIISPELFCTSWAYKHLFSITYGLFKVEIPHRHTIL